MLEDYALFYLSILCAIPGYVAGRLKKTKILIGLCIFLGFLFYLSLCLMLGLVFSDDVSSNASFRTQAVSASFGLLGAFFCFFGGFIGRKVADKK